MKQLFSAFSVLSLCASLLLASQVFAQSGGTSGGPSTNALYPPTTALTPYVGGTIQGDYVAAGVGMRNVGSGDITLSIPAGGTLIRAFLFWAIIWDNVTPPNTGTLNSTPIVGTLAGTSGSPCWGGDGINFYSADVTGIAVDGLNSLTGFPSGLTNNAPPQGNAVFPLLEGATLVLVFTHPMWDYNSIMLFSGATTFSNQAVTYGLGSFTGTTAGNPADQLAQHTYVMADGQSIFVGGGTAFNGTPTSGPGTGIKTLDAFNGADGIGPVSATDGLWDTHTLDVSSFFPNAINTAATAEASATSDCLTWGAHVISVKTRLNAFVDIKPGSCPNSFNVNSRGNLPVAILGSAGFDVSNIDPSTVELNGVPASGGNSMSDVSTPFVGEQDDCMDCNTTGPDGMTDRVFHFNSQAVAATLGNVATNDCVVATITGEFMDGTSFSGSDILRIINNGPKDAPEGLASFELALDQNSPNPFVDGTSFSYSIPDEGIVNLAIYNALGQKVATVLHGTQTAGSHNASWNGLNDFGARVAPGVYLYRLESGNRSLSKKLVISK